MHWMYVWRSAVEEPGNSAIEGRLESRGSRNGGMHWSEDWSSAVVGAVKQRSEGGTGFMHWMYDWRQALEEHWNSALQGRKDSHGFSNGTMHRSDDRTSAVEGALD